MKDNAKLPEGKEAQGPLFPKVSCATNSNSKSLELTTFFKSSTQPSSKF